MKEAWEIEKHGLFVFRGDVYRSSGKEYEGTVEVERIGSYDDKEFTYRPPMVTEFNKYQDVQPIKLEIVVIER